MNLFGNLFVDIVALILFIILSIGAGSLVRGAIRDGPPKVLAEGELFKEGIYNFLVGFIVLGSVFSALKEWFT